MRTLAHSLAIGIALALGAGFAPRADACAPPQHSTLTDERLGFELERPRDWTAIPVKLDEEWIVARFMGDRIYSYTDRRTGYTYEERAELWVVRLAGGAEGAPALASYAEYVPTAFRRHEHYIKETGEAEAGGLKALTYDVRVHPRWGSGGRRVTAWEYDLDGVRIAVQFNVPEDAEKKLRGEVRRCLESVKAIPRVEGALDAAPEVAARSSSDSPVVRLEAALAREAQLHAFAEETAPDGWEVERVGRVLVVHHDARSRGRDFAEGVEATFAWLEETFPEVGRNDYVCGPILRVCKDYDELSAIRKGSTSTYSGSGVEVLACKGNWGGASYQVDLVLRRALEIWFSQRDPDVYAALPAWIWWGLRDLMADAKTKRGKLAFKDDARDRKKLHSAVKHDTLGDVRDLFLTSYGDFKKVTVAEEQAGVLVAYLAGRDARKKSLFKTLLSDYMRNLSDVVAEIRAEERALEEAEEAEEAAEEDAEHSEGAEDEPEETEEERAERRQAEREAWAARERRVLEQTFQRTFGAWSEDDWKSLEKAFLRAVR